MIGIDFPEEIKKEMEKKGGWERIKKDVLKKDMKRAEEAIKAIANKRRLRILYALSKQKMCVHARRFNGLLLFKMLLSYIKIKRSWFDKSKQNWKLHHLFSDASWKKNNKRF